MPSAIENGDLGLEVARPNSSLGNGKLNGKPANNGFGTNGLYTISDTSMEAVIMTANAIPVGSSPLAQANKGAVGGAPPAKGPLARVNSAEPKPRPESVKLAENLGAVLEELTRSQIGDVEGMVKVIVRQQSDDQYGKIQHLLERQADEYAKASERLLHEQALRYEGRIESLLEDHTRQQEKLAEKQKRQRGEEIAEIQRSVSQLKKQSTGTKLKRYLTGKKKE